MHIIYWIPKNQAMFFEHHTYTWVKHLFCSGHIDQPRTPKRGIKPEIKPNNAAS